jgi:transposase
MLIYKAFKYRIYPNKEQERALAVQFGCARFVYNWGLAARKAHYEEHGKGLSFNDACYTLTLIKRFIPWLRESNAQVLQQALKDLDRAYKNFFDGRSGHPKFKSKYDEQSRIGPGNPTPKGWIVRNIGPGMRLVREPGRVKKLWAWLISWARKG